MFNSRLARCRAPSQPYQKKAAVEAQSSSGDISPVSWARLRPRAKTSCHSAKTAESCSRKFSGNVLTSCASFPARQPERCHLVPHFADEGPEAAQRGQGCVREATLQLLRDGEPVAVYEFRAEPFLCLEIVVERTPRNTRALQYLVDPHCGIAFFRQHFRPDVDQHFPGQQFVAALLGRAATAFGVLRVILHG